MRVLIITILLSSVMTLKGQIADNTRRFNERNIYYESLRQYLISELKKEVKHEYIYIEENGVITDSLILQFNNTKFIIVSSEEIQNLLNKQPYITVIRIFPLNYAKEYFTVGFVPYVVQKDSITNKISYGNGGGCHVFFKYINQVFVFETIECYGI